MPIFDTPEPISATVELPAGDVRITASDRADTVVEVRPSDEDDANDVKAAKQTRVEYANGRLLVKTPRLHAYFSKRGGSVEVSVELPTGSHVHCEGAAAELRCTGTLGESRFKTSAGHIRLDRTGPLRLDTSAGDVTVDRVTGTAEVSTGSGKLRIAELDGPATIKNSNGDIHISRVTGDLRVRAANGSIAVDHAGSGVDAKTANGSIRVNEVTRGTVVLETAMGDVEVGIADGTAAWLDLHTSFGRVSKSLDDSAHPDKSDETVEVRANTSYGDITVRRS